MRRNNATGIIAVYADLTRYKLSLAVTFSSVTGYFIFHNKIEITLLCLICGVFFLAAGSAVMNQVTEVRYDSMMGRTMQRPLPQEKISLGKALLLSGALFCTGIFLLLITGFIPSLLGIFNIILYNFIYTKLKRVTPLAIIPGALVGAIPPLIGFEAAGGGVPGNEIIVFSAFMFLWQLPHFWLILLKYHEEYETAGFVTISHLMNGRQIRVLIFLWGLFSTIFLLSFSVIGVLFSRYISLVLIPLNIVFILAFYYLLFRKSEKNEFHGAFILINSFSLLIMILFITGSFFS